eukprot:328294-Lingulodinium_polyedra.AAC.1
MDPRVRAAAFFFDQGPELEPAPGRSPAKEKEALACDQLAERQRVHLGQVLRNRAKDPGPPPTRWQQRFVESV